VAQMVHMAGMERRRRGGLKLTQRLVVFGVKYRCVAKGRDILQLAGRRRCPGFLDALVDWRSPCGKSGCLRT